ncbi:serine acetyltransferase [Candidatus Peregrinibacteria bacterium]|nr:MAG: serine acetyltransferase [Candidatus Peregrinibacteria bacterium]
MKLPFFVRQLFFFPQDFVAGFRNDPALRGKWFGVLELLTYPGIWAVLFHRIAHLLFAIRIPLFPRILSQISRFLTGIEIHPGAKIGSGFFIDHGMGVVIGETAEIGNNVLMYHEVTLGGTTLSPGKRHPTVEDEVLIGAGAKIFGPVIIGKRSQIGGGSVVVSDVPAHSVVVGNPGHIIRQNGKRTAPVKTVDQTGLPDPIRERIEKLESSVFSGKK